MLTKQERAVVLAKARKIADGAVIAGRQMTPAELEQVQQILNDVDQSDLEAKTAEQSERFKRDQDLLARLAVPMPGQGDDDEPYAFKGAPMLAAFEKTWGGRIIKAMRTATGQLGLKSLLSGTIDTPPAVEIEPLPDVPTALLDLIPRHSVGANTYSYLRQSARTNNAAVVADNAEKPQSTYTFEEIENRARVIAHLSEAFPIRYLQDYAALATVLNSEMRGGLMKALETEIVSGDGTGEHFVGLLTTSGVTDVAYLGDVFSTIRRARTTMQNLGENPNGWVLNPSDAETIELTRETSSAGGFLLGSSAEASIFGNIPRVVSAQIPQGTALLADWTATGLGIREEANVLATTQSGSLFQKNQVQVRAEGRFSLDVFRPQAVAVVHLTDTGSSSSS